MPFSEQEHLDNLLRHIELVRSACLLLAKRLIAKGRPEFGRILIARSLLHDASKFSGIEWDYLHAGKDIPKDQLELAVKQHVYTNDHHPEYWGSVENMPEICIAEMVCDWYARSQEFGTSLREWIEKEAIKRYQINTKSRQYKNIKKFVDLLLENSFAG